jgi:hypothetical protein
MSDQVLREYLVSLGFKVDAVARSKFSNGLTQMDKTAGALGKTILGVTAAATTMTTIFSREMEKLYYATRRIKSSATNIQALEFGGGQIGVGAERMRGALESMARALRANPGLQGLLNSLGVKVEGRDRSDVLTDFVTQLKKMPSYVAEQYAGLFGIDADTLFMLQDGLDKLKEARDLRKQMATDIGFDADKAAEAGVKFANSMKEVWERVGLIGSRISTEMLPPMQKFADFLNRNLDSMGKWLGKHKTLGDAVLSPFKEESSRREGAPKNLFDWIFTHRVDPKKPGEPKGFLGSGADAAPGAPAADQKKDPKQILGQLEKQYAIPAGMLGRMWKKESGEGKYMLSPKGAKGHLQFMDPTAAQYGVADPMDFEQSAGGAARYMSDLMKKYKGDATLAAAAYNWGPGNLDRHGLGRAPAETLDYVNTVAPKVEQTNNYYINGAGDTKAVADRVAAQQRETNIDLVRNFTPRVQ